MYMNMIYKTKDTALNLAWKIVVNTYFLFYSTTYILRKIQPIIGSIFYNNNLSSIQFIKDGEIIDEIFLTKNILMQLNSNDKEISFNLYKIYPKYDFILYKFVGDTENTKDYTIRYNNINELIENKLNFKKCNIEFLTIILVYNGIRYSIDLKKNRSYYIVNNYILDYYFIKYYINKYYNFKTDLNEEYELIVLDNKCNTIHLNKNDYIILSENDYNVIYNKPLFSNSEVHEELDNNLLDEIANQLNNDDDSKKSANSKESDCENLSNIDYKNSQNTNNSQKINNSESYYKYIQKTINFFNWTKY
jgi:hypothetical protein